MTADEFFVLVERMRTAQKAFFKAGRDLQQPALTPHDKGRLKTEQGQSLSDSKRLEREVDQAIKAHKAAQRQPSLFGDGEP